MITESVKVQIGYFRVKAIEIIKPEFYIDTM
jgi:hypothetical protein